MKPSVRLITSILIGILSLSIMARAQKFEVGIQGGAGGTYIYGNSVCKDFIKPLVDRAGCPLKVVVGGTAGLVFRYNFIKHFSLCTGLSYERKGTEYAYSDGWHASDFLFHFDYLTLPVMIRTRWGKTVRFTAAAGTYFSFMLHQEYVDATTKTVLDPNIFYGYYPDQSLSVKPSLDFGAIISIGGEVTVWKRLSVSLELSDHLGLINTNRQVYFYPYTDVIYPDDSRSFNNAILLSLGFVYGIGK